MSKPKAAPVYDESKIKTLSALEHIRTRPGMYIGRLGNGSHPDDGIYVLLKEVIDNSVDEFIMGAGRKIEVDVRSDSTVRVRDFGRGIPLGKLVECVSHINTGGKYNSDVFQFSVGLNGVGLKAVNALSRSFTATAVRDGDFARATFRDGVLHLEETGKTQEATGTEIVFEPDPGFFPNYKFDEKIIRRRMWNYAWLNSGLTIAWNNEKFHSKNGLLDLLAEKVTDEKLYDPVYFKSDTLEFAFTHTPDFGESYFSFVNGQYTNDGGTHQSAFREGILKAFNEFTGKNFDGSDVRNGVVGAVAVKLKEPIFESQTKNKLGNNEIRGDIVAKVKDVILAWLYKNPETAERMQEKITQNEKVRREIQSVQKEAREKAKKAMLKIPGLRDCKYHLCDGTEDGARSTLFLTEGLSAGGSMLPSRDVDTQAIFCLRGKPLNCHGLDRGTVYKNEELYYIMRALDIEEGLDTLRYEKVVIATDADVDGLHIRNLLITFFLTYFEPLVVANHVFILETPLFRVRNKKETLYCFDEKERDGALDKLGRGAEVTRFKGLGEISPSEFGQFIGEEIRLLPVNVESRRNAEGYLEFFMGKNTPDRRRYIMDRLV